MRTAIDEILDNNLGERATFKLFGLMKVALSSMVGLSPQVRAWIRDGKVPKEGFNKTSKLQIARLFWSLELLQEEMSDIKL